MYGTFTFGDLVIDLDTDTATKAGQPHTLTEVELLGAQGQRDQIDATRAYRAEEALAENPVLAAESALWARLTANPLTPHLNPGA